MSFSSEYTGSAIHTSINDDEDEEAIDLIDKLSNCNDIFNKRIVKESLENIRDQSQK